MYTVVQFDPQLVADGLTYSSIIVLGSIGLSLIYDIADFPNFAHGDLMAVGAFGALAASGAGLPFPLAVVAGMVAGAAVAVATNRIVFDSMDAGPLELLIASIGVAFVYRAVLMQWFGTESKSYAVDGQTPLAPIRDVVGVTVTERELAILVSTVVLVVALHVLLQYTTLGRKMRATSANPSLARVSGIRTDRVVAAMWIVGGALAAAGGVFLGLETIIRPRMGFDILLVLFAAVILGGIGSVYGAMLGGFVIGMVHELTPAIPVVPTKYNTALAFVIMIAILLVRPSGIMGEVRT
jgi:branched-chain amino acid transport system permease protein